MRHAAVRLLLHLRRQVGAGDGDQAYQLFLDFLHHGDDLLDHLAGEILVVLRHHDIGHLRFNFIAFFADASEEAVEILAEGEEIAFRHLAIAELGPALLDAVGFLGEVVDDVHRRFGGGHGLVRRVLGLGDDEVEAFLGVGDFFLGQFDDAIVVGEIVDGLVDLAGQLAQFEKQRRFAQRGQLADQPVGLLVLAGLQRLAQFVEALDIFLGQIAGLGLSAHPSSLSKIFSIFSFSVAAVKGLTM